MFSLKEIIRQNNPKPGDFKKQVEKNKKFNTRLEIISLEKWSYEKKQEELNKLFEGRE